MLVTEAFSTKIGPKQGVIFQRWGHTTKIPSVIRCLLVHIKTLAGHSNPLKCYKTCRMPKIPIFLIWQFWSKYVRIEFCKFCPAHTHPTPQTHHTTACTPSRGPIACIPHLCCHVMCLVLVNRASTWILWKPLLRGKSLQASLHVLWNKKLNRCASPQYLFRIRKRVYKSLEKIYHI